MRNFVKLSITLFMGVVLFACGGGPTDKEGKALKAGEQYIMTKEGLEHAPYVKDRFGNKLEVGKEYVMTPAGLELVPYLRDKFGAKVELGNEYMMTEDGLKLVQSRNIRGVIQDSAGKPIPGIDVGLAKTDYKATTEANGVFTLPFIEGYARLTLEAPNLPQWCRLEKLENVMLSREQHPAGWEVGAIKLPCAFMGTKDDKSRWATPDGQYVDNGDGTVSDLENKLMWEAEVKEHAIPWNRAEEYTKELNLGGQSDWRMPTPDELTALFQSNIACGWHGPTLVSGSTSVWTSEQVSPESALVMNICTGKTRKSTSLDEGQGANPSVLAVRQSK